jgi:hypothetical protein
MSVLARWREVAEQQEAVVGAAPGESLEAEVRRLWREVETLRQERDFAKKRRRTSRMSSGECEVRLHGGPRGGLSSAVDGPRVLGVSASGYYAAQRQPLSPRGHRDRDLTTRMVVRAVSRGTYGAPRVHLALRHAGKGVSRKRVARLMQGAAFVGTTPRRWRSQCPSAATATRPNVLARAFAPSAALNTALAAEIAYLHYRGGTAYLAVVLDLASRAMIGWALEPHLLTTLPVAALRMALRARRRHGPLQLGHWIASDDTFEPDLQWIDHP